MSLLAILIFCLVCLLLHQLFFYLTDFTNDALLPHTETPCLYVETNISASTHISIDIDISDEINPVKAKIYVQTNVKEKMFETNLANLVFN